MKIIKYLLAVLLIFTCMIGCGGGSQENDKPTFSQKEIDEFKNDFEYEGSITDCNVKITKYIGLKNDVIIPGFVECIGESAFMNYTSLTNVTIPNTVKVIEKLAFANCSNLTKVIIPDSVEFIYNSVFSGCSNLKDVTLGKNLVEISYFVFYDCQNLENIYYTGSIEKWCEISFSGSVMSFAEHFFMLNKDKKWYEVTDIRIPLGVKKINPYTFLDFENVESITIPVSVKEIGISAMDINTVYYLGTVEEWNEIDISYDVIDYFGQTVRYGHALYYTNSFYIKDANNEWIDVIDQVDNIIVD